MFFDKKVKNWNAWDVALTKLSVAAFVLFVLTIWSVTMDWVKSVSPWYFFIAFVIFAIRPFYKFFK